MLMINLFRKMANILYPNKCPYCLSPMDGDLEACSNCKKLITRYDRITKVYEDKGPDMQTRGHTSYAVAPFFYSDMVKKAILMFKFRGSTNFLNSFGVSMYNCFCAKLSGNNYDFIACAPLNTARRRERGYNQSELLAKELSGRSGIKYLDILEHCKKNNIQHELNREQRSSNVQGAYRVTDRSMVEGKAFLVVDDIVTSKSTLREICKTLYESGAKHVDCICLARAGLRDSD